MAMGTRKSRERQEVLWYRSEVAEAPGHPFYRKLEEMLKQAGFDKFCERECKRYYADGVGRPSLAPGVYFRLMLIGFFEGLDSERGIAWRVADSLSLREFLGYGIDESTPDHVTVSRTRRLFDTDTHQKVFSWVLEQLARAGLVKGKTMGVDSTTLEANAAMRSIVRRETGENYLEFLKRVAAADGETAPDAAALRRMDRKRKKKGCNKQWKHPHDPDARVAQMKDGSTHLAHKVEHAVDMNSGALLAVTLQGADQGDTTTLVATLAEAQEAAREANGGGIDEMTADKGYHSGKVLDRLYLEDVRSYIPERDCGRRDWTDKEWEQRQVYANRRRVRGPHGRQLLKKRGELLERSMAHMYETGGMRRLHLRGRENILKRLVVQAAGFNLGLVMRKRFGAGKPRQAAGLAGLVCALLTARHALMRRLDAWWQSLSFTSLEFFSAVIMRPVAENATTATGC